MDINNVASYLTLDPSRLFRAEKCLEQALVMFDRDEELTENYLKEHLAGESLKYAMQLLDETTTSYMGVQIHNQGGKFSAPTAGVYGVSSRPELKAKIKEKVLKKNELEKKQRSMKKESLDPVGKEDADIDNDGKKNDKNDKYLRKRRSAIGKAIATRNEGVEIDEATAMAKRGYDETKLRKRAGGGESADRATALEKKPTFGDANKAKQRQNYARAQRGDFRKTASSSPGLHGYAHKSDDPKVKAKQAARGAQRGALTPNEKKQLNMGEEFELWVNNLVEEGYDLSEYTWEEMEEFYLDEAITSEKGKAKAAEMIAKRTTASGRAKSGQGASVAAIKHISRANVDGYGGTPPNPKVAKNPVKSNFTGLKMGTGNKAARRAAALKKEDLDIIEDMLEIFIEEFIDEGYHEDDIFEAFEESLEEATVTYGHDTEKPYEKNTSTRRLVKAVGRLARRTLKKKGAELKQKATAKYQEKKSGLKKGIRNIALKVADRMKEEVENIEEKAPPGAKYERMVKHIKKGYSKGGLTDKERSIAYATAWKAKKNEETICPSCGQDPCECDIIEQFNLLKDYLFENDIVNTEEDVLEVFENITDEELDYCLEQAMVQLKGKRKGNVVINPEVKKVNESDEQKSMQLQKRQLMLNKQKIALQQNATSKKKPVDMHVEENLQEVDMSTRAVEFGAEIERTNVRQKKEKKGLKDFKKLYCQKEDTMSEEDYDRMKDRRMERGGVDGNTNYRKPASTQTGPKKAPKKGGPSAIDIVRQQIIAKHGKNALM